MRLWNLPLMEMCISQEIFILEPDLFYYSHDGYRFSVNGKIRAQEIKVYTGWADYVFADNYELLTLEETEAYINENKHLPGIPSEKEIEANEGVNLGEMQKLQMAKIEELTLYMSHEKRIRKIEARERSVESHYSKVVINFL